MCLIALSWQPETDTPLVLVANRDEYFNRPTRYMNAWPDHSGVVAGQDLQAGGTWFGVNISNLRFAALTNIRRPIYRDAGRRSRGHLVAGFLTSTLSIEQYCDQIDQHRSDYSGFNLLLFDSQTMMHFNSEQDPQAVRPGVHALSNASLDSEDWPKVRSARTKLARWLEQRKSIEPLAGLLNSRELAVAKDLPETGIEQDIEQQLSAEFIQMQGYGTRCSTALIWNTDTIELLEHSYNPSGQVIHQAAFTFQQPFD